MLFSSDHLKELFQSSDVNTNFVAIERIMLDSRDNLPNSLFIPIIGEHFDAHDYLDQAIENGAVAALWDASREIPEIHKERCQFYVVEDTIKGLQKLARFYRNRVNPIVIGITGSNGKTTTKDLVSAVLQTKYRTHKTAGNYNNHIGLPITILTMPLDTEILILEMGMNQFKEIDVLTKIATPDYAIITNIGESHIEHLGSRAGIAQAKLEIKNGLKENGTVIIDGDEALLMKQRTVQNVISCGFSAENEPFHISHVKITGKTTDFQVADEEYSVPLLGAHHAKNATFAIIIAKQFAMTQSEIQTGFTHLEHSGMRFEQFIGKNNTTIINDAYNASPTSMKAAIEVVKQMTQFNRKVLVLGDIRELGDETEKYHLDVAETITPPIDIVFTFGDQAASISEYVQTHQRAIISRHFTNKEQLIQALQSCLNDETVILFKASRVLALEKVVEAFV